MKKIITISREFGAGGAEIGKKVANALGFEYYDKSLILRAASEHDIDISNVLQNDEKAPDLSGFTQALFNFYSTPLNERIFEAQKAVIREFGEHGNCVIVGRNANNILSQFDNSLHVFIRAEKFWRVQRLKNEQMKDYTEQQIAKNLEKVDRQRQKYCKYYTNSEFGASDAYDLCLNTSKIPIDDCVEIICSLAKK